eukprot:TRINITY_DN16875_c0_g1_i1.p1 TRINITY_DN16875_c0_g1~~TRINITY_DN16875_c0_g1_i1.p1  ORF type:complete len:453 (+),score=128.03 TRINITY_DN16875_c0_g1_i1:142-1500(+)
MLQHTKHLRLGGVASTARYVWKPGPTKAGMMVTGYLASDMQSRRFKEIKPWRRQGAPSGTKRWRFKTQAAGDPMNNALRKLQWGDMADKLPTSIYHMPGPIHSSDPQEQGYMHRPIAPELAGQYEAKPWLVPEMYPQNHPLSRMPPPVQNIAAMAERDRNWRSNREYVSMAEGEVVTPFEILELEYRRTGHWLKSGRHMRTMVTVVVGNGAGAAGVGVGEARSYIQARDLGVKNAYGNLIGIDPDMWTVPHPVNAEFNRTKAQMLPANSMTGTGFAADCLAALGLRSGNLQIKKQRHKKYKRLMTMFGMLRDVRSPKVIAQQRGMSQSSLRNELFTYFEQVRRRRGMFEVSPPGTDGMFTPDRVIDNRLPTHLKRQYFAGTSEAHHADAAESQTYRADQGIQRYGIHNQPYLDLSVEPADKATWLGLVGGGITPAFTKGRKTAGREQWLSHA